MLETFFLTINEWIAGGATFAPVGYQRKAGQPVNSIS